MVNTKDEIVSHINSQLLKKFNITPGFDKTVKVVKWFYRMPEENIESWLELANIIYNWEVDYRKKNLRFYAFQELDNIKEFDIALKSLFKEIKQHYPIDLIKHN